MSYLETWSSSLRFGSSLLDLGLTTGSVVVTLLPTSLELPIVVSHNKLPWFVLP